MSAPFMLGLTGSIGMGKSTTANLFRDQGVPVWDADAAVHRLYAPGGGAVAEIAAMRPEAVIDGAVSRAALKDWIAADPDALARIEARVHPLVAADRAAFADRHGGAGLIVFDIPLLFETGAEAAFDGVLVVTAPERTQRARVLRRAGMDEAAFAAILSRQLSDAEKRARADYVIETVTIDAARLAVQDVIARIERGAGHA